MTSRWRSIFNALVNVQEAFAVWAMFSVGDTETYPALVRACEQLVRVVKANDVT